MDSAIVPSTPYLTKTPNFTNQRPPSPPQKTGQSGLAKKVLYEGRQWFAQEWVRRMGVAPLDSRDRLSPHGLTGRSNNTSNAVLRKRKFEGTLDDRRDQIKKRREALGEGGEGQLAVGAPGEGEGGEEEGGGKTSAEGGDGKEGGEGEEEEGKKGAPKADFATRMMAKMMGGEFTPVRSNLGSYLASISFRFVSVYMCTLDLLKISHTSNQISLQVVFAAVHLSSACKFMQLLITTLNFALPSSFPFHIPSPFSTAVRQLRASPGPPPQGPHWPGLQGHVSTGGPPRGVLQAAAGRRAAGEPAGGAGRVGGQGEKKECQTLSDNVRQ